MRHRRKRSKLGVKSQHRQALLRNLLKNLVTYKRIRTTLVKAKEASSFSERMIEIAKRGDLHARRLLISKLGSSEVAHSLIKDIAPHFKERKGGYTRILRLDNRPGDGAQMALLEFSVTMEAPKKDKKKKKKTGKIVDKAKEGAPKKGDESVREPVKEDLKGKDMKDTEKHGGFLGKLRKFLKGDNE